MTNKETVNIELLRSKVSESVKHKDFFTIVLGRTRSRSVTTYSSVKKTFKDYGLPLSKEDFLVLCSDLEAANAGTTESRGRTKVFHWKWSMKSIAEAVLVDSALATSANLKPQAETRAKLPKLNSLLPHRKQADKTLRLNQKPYINQIVALRREKSLETSPSEKVTIRKNGFEIDVSMNDMTDEGYSKLSTLLLKIAK